MSKPPKDEASPTRDDGDRAWDAETVPASPGGTRRRTPAPTPVSFSGYEILREIHRGAQGVVYLAIQKGTKRKVAIKVLREGPFADARSKARFDREVQVLGRLKHPNIVTIHDSGAEGGHVYYVMDYISGQPLDEHVAHTDRSIEGTLRLFGRICEAVGAAHLKGIVHRDLKPSNIRIDTEGEPHVLDFGLAKVALGDTTDETRPQLMTVTGQFVGSLPWASPEQAGASPQMIDVRSDVYSLGVILFQMLTAQFPYDVEGSMRDVLGNILEAEPAQPSAVRKQIDAEVDTIVLKCLQKEPARRYQSAGELARDIDRYLAGEPIEASRDSMSYLLRKRSRRYVQKHPVVSSLVILFLAVSVAQKVGIPFAYRWTPINRAFEYLVTEVFAPPTDFAAFEHVRVIALTDETDVEALARREGLSDVSSQNWRSVRRLHGRLMERLASSGASAVAWDIAFASETEFDQDLLRGVRALKEAGVEVTVGVRTWWLGEQKLPRMSKVIMPEVRWGAMTATLSADDPWGLDLVVQRGRTDPLPSLALAAVLSARQPGAEASFSLDRRTGMLEIRYWKPDPEIPRAKQWLARQHRIKLSALQSEELGAPELGLQAGDTVGYFFLDVPDTNVLDASVIDYGRVFSADEAQLARWFGGKVVVVGDHRAGVDRYGHPDGRTLSGCYAHATGMDALLRAVSIRTPTTAQDYALTGAAALFGLLIAFNAASRRIGRWLALTALTAAVCLASVWVYRESRLLYDPVVPIIALVVSGELAAFTFRLRRAHR